MQAEYTELPLIAASRLTLGLSVDRNVGIGLPPQPKEVLVRASGSRPIAFLCLSTTKLHMGKCTGRAAHIPNCGCLADVVASAARRHRAS